MHKKNLTIEETFALAFQNYQKNNLKIAENLYKEILETNPNHAATHNNLGIVFKKLGEREKAMNSYQKAIEIQPDYAQAHFNLGIVFKELEEFQKAINCYQKAVEINPNYPATYFNLGIAFKELGEFVKAVRNYQKAIEIQPDYAQAHFNLGIVFKELEEFQKAINCYQKAVEINPNYAAAYFKLGIAFKELGEFAKAISCYQKATKYKSENLVSIYHLSELKKEILDANLKNKIVKIINNDKCTKKNLAFGNFLLSKYELKKKNYEKEFNYLLKGHLYYFDSEKEKFKKGIDYWLNNLPNIKELVNFNKSNKNIKKTNYKIKPIFIVGVPRCGSTLIEKIIASSTKSIPIGEEISILSNFVKQKIIQKQSLEYEIEDFSTKLLESYKQKGLIQEKSNYIFTDKTLDNFFYIGLIKKIFPNARVINCRRNPLSSIMSILKNNLPAVPWAHNLEHIFKYFDAYYRIIESFKKTFPNFIYELQLEKFVSDPKNESKKLMKFCDLPWDKKCLEFYKRKDLISKTSSNIQIRKTIYKHSIQKYQPYTQLLKKYKNKYYWFN